MNSMTIFQMISIIFAFCMMYLVSIHHRKKLISGAELSLWLSTWFVFIIISLFPNLLLGLVGVLRFDRVFDLLLVIALMILTTIVFGMYFKQKQLKSELETYVREDALKSAVKKKK